MMIDKSLLIKELKNIDIPSISIDTRMVPSVNKLFFAEYFHIDNIEEIGYPFPIVNEMKYAEYNGFIYNEGKDHKTKRIHAFPSLTLNIPFEYYSKQDIPNDIISIIDNKYIFKGINNSDAIGLFEDICNKGIPTRFSMEIRGGKLYSDNPIDYIILLIAIWIKLPSIPITLYMISDYISDYYNTKLFYPYYIFGSINEPESNLDGKHYVSMMSNDNNPRDWYLSDIIDVNDIDNLPIVGEYSDSDIDRINRENKIRLGEKLNNEINSYINNYNF